MTARQRAAALLRKVADRLDPDVYRGLRLWGEPQQHGFRVQQGPGVPFDSSAPTIWRGNVVDEEATYERRLAQGWKPARYKCGCLVKEGHLAEGKHTYELDFDA